MASVEGILPHAPSCSPFSASFACSLPEESKQRGRGSNRSSASCICLISEESGEGGRSASSICLLPVGRGEGGMSSCSTCVMPGERGEGALPASSTCLLPADRDHVEEEEGKEGSFPTANLTSK